MKKCLLALCILFLMTSIIACKEKPPPAIPEPLALPTEGDYAGQLIITFELSEDGKFLEVASVEGADGEDSAIVDFDFAARVNTISNLSQFINNTPGQSVDMMFEMRRILMMVQILNDDMELLNEVRDNLIELAKVNLTYQEEGPDQGKDMGYANRVSSELYIIAEYMKNLLAKEKLGWHDNKAEVKEFILETINIAYETATAEYSYLEPPTPEMEAELTEIAGKALALKEEVEGM